MDRLRFVRFEDVDSTNSVALAMAGEGAPHRTVILADSQTRGRGRLGRTWADMPRCSLLMSAICHCSPEDARLLSFAAAAAVAEVLSSECGLPDVTLKWPNDVRSHGRKIAGILVETTSAPNGHAAVVGIGVNVLQTRFPPDLQDLATSIALEGGTCEAVDVLAQLVAERFFELSDREREEILRRWRRYMEGCGRRATVTGEGRTIIGAVTGIDSTGALLITNDRGETVTLHSAESVRFEDN